MIRILHLGTELTWRGGENQMRLLIEGLQSKVETQIAATPRKSVAFREKRWACPTYDLASGSPYDPRNMWKLARLIRKNRIQILDAHTAKAHTLALNVAPFVPDLKIVVHRRVDNVPKSQVLTRRKYLHPRVSVFTAISRFIGQVLIDYGVNPNKVKVARSAVSSKAYEALERSTCQTYWRQKLNLPTNHVLIGNASALSPQKGYETLLQAAAILKTKTQDFSVLIAGDGGLRPSLERLSLQLKLENHVHFVGFLKDVPQFLKSLDILAVPSNNEGLGTIILDGLLAGCSVVASRVGGIPEIIHNHQTGLLIEPGDSQKLAEYLETLIRQPELRLHMAQQGAQWVQREFSLDSMIQGNLMIYQELLAQGGRS
ncbi:MAG: glycosyltransferase [Bdellovibrionales bacterium]